MPSKTEFYRQMADHVATQLTGSWQEWAGFSPLPPAFTSTHSMSS